MTASTRHEDARLAGIGHQLLHVSVGDGAAAPVGRQLLDLRVQDAQLGAHHVGQRLGRPRLDLDAPALGPLPDPLRQPVAARQREDLYIGMRLDGAQQRVSGTDASVGEHHVGGLRHGGQVVAHTLPLRRTLAVPRTGLHTRPSLETRQQTPHDDQPLLRKKRHRAARGAELGERHLPAIEAGYVDVAEVGRRYLLDHRLDLLIDGERVVAVVETYQGLPPVLRQKAAGTGYNIPLR